jgi:hypothetical protein
VTAVILSAVIPTLIAERWFDPNGKALSEEEALTRSSKEIKTVSTAPVLKKGEE